MIRFYLCFKEDTCLCYSETRPVRTGVEEGDQGGRHGPDRAGQVT